MQKLIHEFEKVLFLIILDNCRKIGRVWQINRGVLYEIMNKHG